MSMFATDAQVWKARRMVPCQAAVGISRFISAKRLLGVPATLVPSGAKLSVRWRASGQAMP
jgi:hypothetical protein